MANYFDGSENHFRLFAGNLEAAIKKYEQLPEENLLERQRRQIKSLISLETKFRKTLIEHPWGANVYKQFLSMILDKKRNILAARPYFRERQGIFAAQISKHLKKRSDKGLYKFKFNYSFVLFVLGCAKWPAGGKIAQLAKQINRIRIEIMEMNLPLAISQARIFWSNTPKAHLSYMDLIQIHCLGLLIAIDKFVPPDTKGMTRDEELEAYRKFRAVALGRMIGDRIENYSETVVHFYPVDKRKIYRANKILRFFGPGDEVNYEKIAELINKNADEPVFNSAGEVEELLSSASNVFEKIAILVNLGVDDAHKTNAIEIAELLSSASCVSGDISLDPDGDTTLDRYAANEELRPDLQVEHVDAMINMQSKFKELPLINKKMLRMKGVQI